MAVVCPSCEVLPEPDAPAGTRCRGCGARLIGVKAVEPSIGTVIDGRFEIRERLGSGAMGVVYRATQLSIGRDVALKVLSSIESEPVVKRFFREARIASALSHPSSVQIIEFGQEPNGHVYLAMELVRGHTLMAEIHKGPLPARRLTRIGVQLCDAIEAAHRLQIVHRDLKLENVMLSDDGTDHIRILDFGIARILGDVNTQVTASGLSAGTPHYLAPEVLAHAADPAPAQDVYAVGVILAELALGEPLWTNATSLPMLLIEKMKNTVVDRVPATLRPLVRRLMDPEAAMRPTPAETRRALLDLDRLATDAAGVAPTIIVEPGASLDLDKPYAPVASPKLEIEGDWEKNREARRATPSHEAQRFRREHGPSTGGGGGGRWLLLALVAVAVGGAAVYWYVSTKSARTPAKRAAPIADPAPTPVKPRPPDQPDDDRSPPTDSKHGVSIRIIGLAGMPITIDGSPAGKLPIKLTRSAGKKPIVIEGTGVYRVVIPDRTQTVDLSQ
jgi:serine/threonine protein kinase